MAGVAVQESVTVAGRAERARVARAFEWHYRPLGVYHDPARASAVLLPVVPRE